MIGSSVIGSGWQRHPDTSKLVNNFAKHGASKMRKREKNVGRAPQLLGLLKACCPEYVLGIRVQAEVVKEYDISI